ncbi:hypothetical protein EU538_11045 [Candidatus Thorarchaeota archaeon]|nr:MAG: hypothetical protein EU538_11045 [Candidatus Thorarchaeota archaeon]
MGILGTSASIFADINLIIQIALLVLTIIGIIKSKPYPLHGKIFTVVTFVTLATTLFIMGPALFLKWGDFAAIPFPPGSAIVIVHHLAGLVALILGLLWSYRYIDARRNRKPYTCGSRRMMWLTAILWLYSLFGGIVIYYLVYV